MRQVVWSLLFALVVVVVAETPAEASPKWCEDDPIVVIAHDGTYSWAQVVTKFRYEHLASITGALNYDIYVPEQYLGHTFTFLPPSPVTKTVTVYGLPADYWADWSSDKIKLEVRMYVPASTSFLTSSDVTGSFRNRLTVNSFSNVVTVFRISLHY